MQNAMALYHSDQVHRKRATDLLEVEARGLGRFERPTAKFSISSKKAR